MNGCDIKITSSTVLIFTVLRFFSTSKSICDVVSSATVLLLTTNNAGCPQDFETVKIFAKCCFGKQLFVFYRKVLFRSLPTFCLEFFFQSCSPLPELSIGSFGFIRRPGNFYRKKTLAQNVDQRLSKACAHFRGGLR